MGGRGGGGVEEIMPTTLHCHHRSDCALRWEALDERRFHVYVYLKCIINCEGQSHKTMSTNHKF